MEKRESESWLENILVNFDEVGEKLYFSEGNWKNYQWKMAME